jgi:hypothetical protein
MEVILWNVLINTQKVYICIVLKQMNVAYFQNIAQNIKSGYLMKE